MGTAVERATGASDLADAAARRGGLAIAAIDTPAVAVAAADLLRDIWRTPNGWPVAPEILLVLTHTDNYAVAAHCQGRLVAVSAAWRTGGARPHLHSHITGVLDGHRGRSVGRALKLHQRAWALDRGLGTITWTFDPLHRRNAAFNVVRLGARVSGYLPDFYGPMTDGVNRGTPSDRVLVEWDLGREPTGQPAGGVDAPALVDLAPDGRPVRTGALDAGTDVVSLRVPEDVETLRRTRAPLALDWQLTVGGAFQDALAAGYEVVGFDPHRHYVLRRSEHHAP